MPHIMTFFEKDHLAAYDLNGRDVVAVIESVSRVDLPAQAGKKATKKPLVKFQGRKKTLVLNVTNARVIAALYGPKTEEWVGKPVTLYPTTTTFGNESKECIRVRNRVPVPGAKHEAPQQEAQLESEEETSDG